MRPLARCAIPIAGAALCVLAASSAGAATITVTNLDDSGVGSLRWAIEQANLPGPDDIEFDGLSGFILNSTALPLITDNRTRILGETGDIELHGIAAVGLNFFEADSCVIRGLEIDGYVRGIALQECEYTTIGGELPEHRMYLHDNLWFGIEMRDGHHSRITNCLIENNGQYGVILSGSTSVPSLNTLGGDSYAAGNEIYGNSDGGVALLGDKETTVSHNIISGNGGNGISILSPSNGLVIQFNIIGLDADGRSPRGNAGNGIGFIAPHTGDSEIFGNLISANSANGIYMVDSRDNEIWGNVIGTDIDGVEPLPNGDEPGEGGILLDYFCENNAIGPQNTIVAHDGEGQFGIALMNDARFNGIHNNRIGLHPNRDIDVPNRVGILIEAPDNTIGLLNVISGNSSHGIVVRSHPTTILGNFIGTNFGGDDAFGNESGIYLEDGRCTIGGDGYNGNVISGNRAWGIEAHAGGDEFMEDVTISGNRIGWGWNQTPLGNGAGGIWMGENFLRCMIGAESFDERDRANGIAYNQGPGIRIGEDGASPQSSEIPILTNFFLGNTGKAIDLFSSSPPGNEGIRPPTILTAGTGSASGTVTLPTNENGGRIQLFYTEENTAQGTFEIGELDIVGNTWSYDFPSPIPSDVYVTATFTSPATGDFRNTSEFSEPVSAQRLQAHLDIQPGSCTNPLSPAKKGVIPAAIVGDAEFDVADIDPASIRLEGVAPTQTRIEDVAAAPGQEPCACTTEGSDGVDDLSMKFLATAVVEALGPARHGDEKALSLTGNLLDGTPFAGTDCIVIKGGMKNDAASGLGPDETGSEAATFGIVSTGSPRDADQRVTYLLAESGQVRITVFDVSGRMVRELRASGTGSGERTLVWNSTGLPSGIYFYHLQRGTRIATRKIALIR